jgi:putative peptidoglycan lipid II flippase
MTASLPHTDIKNLSHAKWHAFLVGSGIFLSRIAGLVRDRVFAHYFGNSDAADAFKAAFRIPNILQNLFGEGVLSASFIPVYANLLARGKEEEANRLAGAVAAILMLTTSMLVLAGVLATPYLIDAIAPGFEGAKRELCIQLVRILFPGAGLLVWSAWCLGILNSHSRFFLSYTAPVVWNLVIIATLALFGGAWGQFPLAAITAWGSVAGSALQIVVQLPMVLKLVKRMRLSLDHRLESVRTVIRGFVPVFFSRGVVQISAYVDSILASLLPTGAVAALSYALTLYTLPVSLFGMSVSAAELPAMSKALGSDSEIAGHLRERLNTGLRQIAFFIVPSAVAFIALGDVIAAAIYQTGKFGHSDAVYVWSILAGCAVGLLATTLGRLYSSTFYSLRDTRTPLRFAVIRVVLTTILGYLASQQLPALVGVPQRWGVAGITAASGFCGWIEFSLLRYSLDRRIGKSGPGLNYVARLWVAAGTGAAAAWGVKLYTLHWHPLLQALFVLGTFGIVYCAIALAMKIPEVRSLIRFMEFFRK